MEWQTAPGGQVFRKRLHLYGPKESGQVTSIVRFEPDSTFSMHDHPEGEEILVLEGVFSDEAGDWKAGSYLLNPEGFRHAPFSKEGCLLFVKLRQYAGEGREYFALNTISGKWTPSGKPGVLTQTLYKNAAFEDETRLERWEPGVKAERDIPGGAELLILEGSLEFDNQSLDTHTWLRLPPEARWQAQTHTGCTFYIKTGGVAGLRSPES